MSASLVDRYQVGLALVALGAGGLIALLDRRVRRDIAAPVLATVVSGRALASIGLVACIVGGWGSTRALPWLIAATAVALYPDRSDRSHPLGSMVMPMCIASLIGLWAALADTEPAVASLFALLPIVVARTGETPSRGLSPGPAGSAALVVMVGGTAWVGSAGLPVLATVVCSIGMIGVAPIVIGWNRVGRPCSRWLAGAHMATALVVPRALMRAGWIEAILVAGLVTAALFGAAAICGPGCRDRAAGDRRSRGS